MDEKKEIFLIFPEIFNMRLRQKCKEDSFEVPSNSPNEGPLLETSDLVVSFR